MSLSRPASPSRPNKRVRLSVGPEEPQIASASGEGSELNRDADFWLEDGNVVVVAQSSAFRVHKSVLARRSEFFSGLFVVPQPENEADIEKVDGCPLVRVQDSAHDFKHLLRALYDGIDASVIGEGPAKFSSLAALLRLSHKYEVRHILDAAVLRLKAAFPSDIKSWKAYEGWKTQHSAWLVAGEAIEIVNVLRTCGFHEMLPAALHACTRLELRTLLRGLARGDGTREILSVEDLERCLAAREELEARSAAFALRMLDYGDPNRPACAAPRKCSSRLSLAWTTAVDTLKSHSPWESETIRRSILVHNLSKLEVHDPSRVCDICMKHIQASDRKLSLELWENLPRIMGVQSEVPVWPPSTTAV